MIKMAKAKIVIDNVSVELEDGNDNYKNIVAYAIAILKRIKETFFEKEKKGSFMVS